MTLKTSHYNSASEALGKLMPEESIFLLTKGHWTLVDLIEAISDQIHGASLKCVTWSIAAADATRIAAMVDCGQLSKITLCLDRSFKTRQSQNIADIVDILGAQNIKSVRSHSKICLLQKDDWYIVVSSSMNLNKNLTCEHAEIHDNKELFLWLDQQITELQCDGIQAHDRQVTLAYATAWGDDITSADNWDDR